MKQLIPQPLGSLIGVALGVASLMGCGDDESKPCSEISVEECTGTAGCALMTALRADGSEENRGQERIPVGCQDRDTGCDGREVYAAGPEGNCWLFPSACLPPGFAESADCKP